MPYIKLTERNKFAVPITDILSILADPNDTPYVKGEYFGYAVNRVAKKFLGDPSYTNTSFNSTFFNESKKKTLSNAADSLAAVCNRADPIHSAGDLHYVLSAIYLGFLGQAAGFSSAPYGLQVYLRGILERVLSTVETVNVGSQRDMAMAFRRHLIIRGVLADVISSAAGAKRCSAGADLSAFSEEMNVPVWNDDGKLVLPSGTALTEVK